MPDFQESIIDRSEDRRVRRGALSRLLREGPEDARPPAAQDHPAGRRRARWRAGQGPLHGFGVEHKPLFWILGNVEVGAGMHIGFSASTRAQVDAFHEAAIRAGVTDNDRPGIRRYHENYYGAFVLDPDGISVEAVCHAPQ